MPNDTPPGPAGQPPDAYDAVLLAWFREQIRINSISARELLADFTAFRRARAGNTGARAAGQ